LGSARGGGNEIDSVLAGLADIRASGSKEDLCYFHALGAEILLDAGRIESALELVATAIRDAELTGELWYLAELHRLQGRLCIASSPKRTEEAIREFKRSLQIARDQKARLWELRAAASLCQLCPDDGEGRRALQSICDWFQEGSSLPDLKDARALIE
jgi:predicted ATPase